MMNLEVKTKVDVSEAVAAQKKLGAGIKSNTDAVDGMSSSLDRMSGGAVTAFKQIVSGAKSGVAAMTTLKGAIAATGIGALVIAVASLTAAFTSSEEGQNKLAKIMAVVNTIVGNGVDLLADFGEKLIWAFENPKKAMNSFVDFFKGQIVNRFNGLLELIPQLSLAVENLFSGNVVEAGRIAADAVGKVSLGVEDLTSKIKGATEATKEFLKEQEKEARLAASVADMRATADKVERDLLVERSKLESNIAELRLKSRQENQFSSEERKAALLEAQKLEDELLDKETKFLELRRDAQVLENTFSRSNKENLDKEAQAIAAVNNQVAQRANTARQLQRELNTIDSQIRSDKNKESAEQLAKEKEDLESTSTQRKEAAERLESERKERLLTIENEIREAKLENQEIELEELIEYERLKMSIELEQVTLTEQEKEAIRISFREKEIQAQMSQNKKSDAIDKKAKDKELKLEEKKEAIKGKLISQGFEFAKLIAGDNAKAQKGIAAAEATFNTYAAIVGTLKGFSTNPTPGLAIAQATATGAFGFAQVANILSTDVSSGGGTPSVSAPSAPSLSESSPDESNSNIPDFSFVNEGVGGNAGASLNRSFVVLQDIEDQRALGDKIDDLSKN